jgi:hypothetical protein
MTNTEENKGGQQAQEPKVDLSSVIFGNEVTNPMTPLNPSPPKNEGDDGGKGGNADPNKTSIQQPNKPELQQSQQPEHQYTEDEQADMVVGMLTSTTEDNMSDEDKNLRQQVYDTFKAKGVDANGNLINEKGEIVLSKEALKEYVITETPPMDEDGNYINALGEIIKDKETIENENSVVYSLINPIQEALGIQLVDDNGQPIQYEDTEAGVIKLVQDSIQKASVGSVQQFLNNQPVLKDVFQHLALGGTMENYRSNTVDYTSIDLKTLDKQGKVDLIRKSFIAQGVRNPNNMLELIQNAGDERINAEAANAVLTLDEIQKQTIKSREIALQQQYIEKQQANDRYWKNVKAIVDKGQLGSINIPDYEKATFFEFLSKPIDKEGRSADMVSEDNQSDDFNLMVSYLRYKNFDISKLATLISKEEKAKTLRQKWDKSSQKVKSANTQNAGGGKEGIVQFPTLSKFLGHKQ